MPVQMILRMEPVSKPDSAWFNWWSCYLFVRVINAAYHDSLIRGVIKTTLKLSSVASDAEKIPLVMVRGNILRFPHVWWHPAVWTNDDFFDHRWERCVGHPKIAGTRGTCCVKELGVVWRGFNHLKSLFSQQKGLDDKLFIKKMLSNQHFKLPFHHIHHQKMGKKSMP